MDPFNDYFTKKHNEKYPYIWFWKVKLPDRKNSPCRVLVRSGKLNSALIEFEDGFKVVSSRNAIRKRKKF